MVRVPKDIVNWCEERGMEVTKDEEDVWRAKGPGVTVQHENEQWAIRLRSGDNETLTVIRASEIEVVGNTLNFHKPHTECALKSLH